MLHIGIYHVQHFRKLFKVYFNPAFNPLITADVKPACSISFNPLMVKPPGVVTLSISASGWFPLACSKSTAPFTVCKTMSLRHLL